MMKIVIIGAESLAREDRFLKEDINTKKVFCEFS